jgi:hypothetical protein
VERIVPVGKWIHGQIPRSGEREHPDPSAIGADAAGDRSSHSRRSAVPVGGVPQCGSEPAGHCGSRAQHERAPIDRHERCVWPVDTAPGIRGSADVPLSVHRPESGRVPVRPRAEPEHAQQVAHGSHLLGPHAERWYRDQLNYGFRPPGFSAGGRPGRREWTHPHHRTYPPGAFARSTLGSRAEPLSLRPFPSARARTAYLPRGSDADAYTNQRLRTGRWPGHHTVPSRLRPRCHHEPPPGHAHLLRASSGHHVSWVPQLGRPSLR